MANIKSEFYNLSALIPTSLEYYDKNNEKYSSFFNNITNSKTIQNNSDMERNRILFYGKDNEIILESQYEFIGFYYKKYNLWCWGWASPILKKNETFIIRKLLNYALEIDLTLKENEQFKFIKTVLINSRSRITDELQLDIHIALASYLSKKKMVYKRKYQLTSDPTNYIEYYLFILDEPK
ncbi:hypothetical protein CPAV1605_433 [seawater metagenome]|uniref:Uncharacterized protein n=1 Tax=seawater metagenome TaxID=1561972 RepID=A0A5E8CH13_9ZZZZ